MIIKKVVAVVGAIGALALVAACSDDTTNGSPTRVPTSHSVPASTTGESTALPAGFPTDIPVIDGEYSPYPTAGENVGLDVSKVEATAFDEAVQKMKSAGYTEEAMNTSMPTAKTSTFTNGKYEVHVNTFDFGSQRHVLYIVSTR